MEILKYPDPTLRRGGKPVTAFDEALRRTAREMLDAMYRFGGVGLAAPQVGLELNLLVLNPSGDAADRSGELALVNPRLVAKKPLEWGEEGCLSFPGIYADVERAKEISVDYLDLEGQPRSLPAAAYLARIIQHEMDHLAGVLFIDRLSAADRIRVKPRLLELERAFKGRPA